MVYKYLGSLKRVDKVSKTNKIMRLFFLNDIPPVP